MAGAMIVSNMLCIIPARGGSKGLPGKNKKILVDKPLISWTIQAAFRSGQFNRVIVSTDDNEIAKIAKESGANVLFRPAELASDTASTVEVVIHVLNYLDAHDNYVPDYVALLQCTSPLRNEEYIIEAVNMFLNYREVDSLISVTKEEHPPWWLRTVNADGYIVRIFDYDKTKYRRQDFNELFRPNGALYIAKTDIILTRKSFQTEKTIPYIMDYVSSIDIDTEVDFELAEYFLNKKMSERIF